MFNATLAGGTSSKYTLRADYLRDSRASSRVDLNHLGSRDSQQLKELELRVGMIQGGDSMEEGEKSCWERRKAALYLTVSALIILSFVILIVYIALGGLNPT